MDGRKHRSPGPAWRAAEEPGHDVSPIEEDLRLTPQERIRQHCEAVRVLSELRDAVEKKRG
jgi:hypothetical protein